MKLLPSIASANQLELKNELDMIDSWPYLHIDIEDGNFIPNITFGKKTLSAVCDYAKNKVIDVHLMTTDPCFWLEQLSGMPIHSIAAHIEALPFPMQFINRAHVFGMKTGLALNIKSSYKDIEPFLNLVDYLLVMTSEPDFAGEELYHPALTKALEIKKQIPQNVELFVDGGLTLDAVKKLKCEGVEAAVLGRLVFSNKDTLQVLKDISNV